jgi:hypothetical protein
MLNTQYQSAKTEVERLVERFARNLDVYKRAEYKETQVRVEFIDPFFEALGWDVRNVQGYAEQYKDVIHEDAIKVSGATRAPDYCFRIGGVRKFFLEAKKPSVSVQEDIGPAYQLRRYAWSAKLPLSILTDFEEFAVYDCRQRPQPTDKVSVGRIIYLTFDQYPDRFDDIYGVFAKESVLKGSFDRYVQDTKGKRGTSEVDAEFLKEIEGWREALARNIALRNPNLSVHELNFSVQRTIDRIIFLRMCEDRGIEEYGRLLALTGGPHIYPRLGDLYRQADEKYDSDLFDFQADTLSKTLTVDDKVLQPILDGLYYPQSPYEFYVLPAEILGQVYEQFLGKVIRLTPSHRAKVEEKPEVKKAGGVYYTPTYIVDYIVQQTVGKLVEDKTPRQISNLRILDPACGSGSFLLGAYQYLLDYHRQWYEAHDPAKHARAKRPALYQSPSPSQGEGRGGGGSWRLTTAEKKRILLNNIYGVDIDRQAVEVTKLSLLLKVLEGENQETLGQQLMLWRERALPDLGDNIKCGNSLIGPDYFEAQLMPDEEEMRRVNPFDWEAGFPEVMAAGGFDCVIGNPPYGAQLSSAVADYLRKRYVAAEYQIDTYPLFIERAYRLSQQKGYLGMIVPSAWVASKFNKELRRFLVSKTMIDTVVIAPKSTFAKATVETLILIARKSQTKGTEFLVERWDRDERISYRFPQGKIANQQSYIFPIYADPVAIKLTEKVRSRGAPLSEYATAVWGVKIYQKGKGKPKQRGLESKAKSFHSSERTKETHKPLLGGKEIRRYVVDWRGMYVDYGEWLAEPRTSNWFEGPRILVREVTSKGVIQATIVTSEFVFSNSVDGIKLRDDKYALAFILGILNSRLISFYHLNTSPNAFKGSFPKVLIKDLLGIPIHTINFDDSEDVARHDKMVALVERMLALHKKLAAATIPADKELYQRQIEATDRQIDALVYELYGLAEEEIGIVESLNR